MKLTTRIEPLEARIAPAFAAVVPLASLDGTNGFKLSGEAGTDFSGRSLSDAGDVNGDGFADVIIGAPKRDEGGIDIGACYVVFGKADGFGASLSLSALDGTNGFKLTGIAVNDYAGKSVSAAGDVNGDGFDDLLIGAYYANEGGTKRGAGYVVFGKAGGFSASVSLSALDGTNGFKLVGAANGDYTGSSISAAGDVNGDGFDDVIIGAYGSNYGGSNRGTTYVVFGKAGGFSASVVLSALNGSNGFLLRGVANDDLAGFSVSAAGDVNGDGFSDVIIGAPNAPEGGNLRGAAYVVFGKATGFFFTASLGTLNGSNGFKLSGVSNGDGIGNSISAAGDVNGDGFDDVLIGAPNADGQRGASYVVFGKAGGFGASLVLSGLDGSNGFKLSAVADFDLSGSSVSTAGDVNGDGFDDLLIGARGADEDSFRGAAYVVFGKAGGFSANLALSGLDGTNGFKLSSVTNFDSTGSSVSTAGDVNGDGFADLLIGAPNADSGARGASYVVFGKADVAVKFTKAGKVATFLDTDGDLVTVKITKGQLTQSDFHFSNGVLQKLDLSSSPLLFGGTNLTVTAKKGFGGDGKFNLGAIDARGLDLGTVTLPGDLGQIDAGDVNFKTPAIKALTLGSLGVAASTQPAGTAAPLQSDLVGALAKLTVKGTMKGSLNLAGGTGANLGTVSIGGDLDGSAGGTFAGLLRAGGNIGAVAVKGSVIGGADFSGIIAGGKLGKVSIGGALTSADVFNPVYISALGDLTATTAAKAVAIAGVSVKTNVLNAFILAGYTASIGAVNPDASIGAVSVGGNWAASSITAGVSDNTGDGFGRNDILFNGDTTPTLIASIASVTIKGTATGSAAAGDFFGITAQRVVKVVTGTFKNTLAAGIAHSLLLDTVNNDFRVVDFA